MPEEIADKVDGALFRLPNGKECARPQDDGLEAAEVCNCRCTTAPVFVLAGAVI